MGVRYVVPFLLQVSGMASVTAGSKGLTLVDGEVSLGSGGGTGGVSLDICRGTYSGGGNAVTVEPLHEGDPAALSTAASGGGGGATGPQLGWYSFSGTTGVAGVRLFHNNPVYIAPGMTVVLQGGSSVGLGLNLYVEE